VKLLNLRYLRCLILRFTLRKSQSKGRANTTTEYQISYVVSFQDGVIMHWAGEKWLETITP